MIFLLSLKSRTFTLNVDFWLLKFLRLGEVLWGPSSGSYSQDPYTPKPHLQSQNLKKFYSLALNISSSSEHNSNFLSFKADVNRWDANLAHAMVENYRFSIIICTASCPQFKVTAISCTVICQSGWIMTSISLPVLWISDTQHQYYRFYRLTGITFSRTLVHYVPPKFLN